MTSQRPSDQLLDLAREAGMKVEGLEFARMMDDKDPLKHFRNEFYYPKMKDMNKVDTSIVDPEEDTVYFCGNSLGLLPKKTEEYIKVELDKWAKKGVQGHFCGDLPWAQCDEVIDPAMAAIVGGLPGEVAIMNGLTVNLHLLLISFYRPTPKRHKILCESKAFPSDHYAFESQINQRGYDPSTSLLLLEPREGEWCIRTEDILRKIEDEGDSIAVILLPGVQYYTGQYFDIPRITKAGQAKGCYVGWDLAHAVGNLELHLHDWGVDFACWCTYKYLCAGAGSLAGAFLHQKHEHNDFPKLQGWWSHKFESRFVMDNNMDASPGIYGYRVTNPAGLLCPAIKAGLELYNRATMPALRKKSLLLTGYLEMLVKNKYGRPTKTPEVPEAVYVDILTPENPEERGCQLSLSFNMSLYVVIDELTKHGVICDKRLPRVLRVTPVAIYCSFEDCYRFMKYLDLALTTARSKGVQNSPS